MNSIEQTISNNLDRVKLCCNGCWEWTGKNWNGPYGRLSHNRQQQYVHRFFYEYFIGLIPLNKEIDHLCKHTWCCNPLHLEAVTQKINLARSNSISTRNSIKTHCLNGHPYSGLNLIIQANGKRVCRTCKLNNHKNWKAKQ